MSDIENGARVAAPYVSWKSLGTLMQDLRTNGVPSRVDRSVLSRFSGSVATQLMAALRFLNLTDNDGVPTEGFRSLIAEHETPQGKDVLIGLLRKAYAPLFELDLGTATQAHFHETFRRHYSGADAVIVKSETFFLQAARDAGVSISPRLEKGKKTHPNNSVSTRKRSTKRADKPAQEQPPLRRSGQPASPEPLSGTIMATNEFQLVALLSPAMSDTERDAVWTLIQYLKAKGTAGAN